MKHLTFRLKEESYKKAQKEAKKSKYKAQLMQVFTSLSAKKEIKKLLKRLSTDFPDCLIVGTTTAGEISHAKMYENETILSLSLFEKTKIQVERTKKIDTKSGQKLAKVLCSKNTKAVIVLSEGLLGEDYEGFIGKLKEENSDVIVAGGLAGDNFQLQKTYVFMGQEIYEEGAIGISFSGKNLYANNDYNLNWNPIGKEFQVTKIDGNILKEIDEKNALEVFKQYLGNEIIEENASVLADFQLLYQEGNTTIARTPMGLEKDAIILAGPIKNQQKFQFGFSNAANLINGADTIGENLFYKPAQAIYIYSCIARKTLLGKALESEFRVFENIAPTAGFFTYGEFYSTSENNALLNCTTTILVLSESKKRSKTSKFKASKVNALESATFTALTHFVKQTSQELSENTQLLEEYKVGVDHSALVSKTDINGNITYVNENFCKVSQYSKKELLGKNHNIVRDPDMSDFIFKKLWKTILSGKVWSGVLSNRAKDGSIYYVDATIVPIFDTKHKIKEFIGIRQDITKQIESKKRIQEKEKLIKAIFDNQDAIVIYASKTKGMLNVNKKLFEIFEYDSFEDFKSQNSCICDLFLEEPGYIYPQKYPNWLDDLVENRFDQPKVKMQIRDKSIHTFTIMAKKIDDEYIINLYDITDLENAILKAHASQQAKSMFLANMSHEIRTPLNGILGFTDILTKRDLDKESKRYIDIIHNSGETLLNVVNDILDFSKIESGELSLAPTEVNLLQEMEATVATFSSVFKTKHIYYYTYIDPALPKVLLCDVQRIKQVINNLISNAVKFTPKDGSVFVSITLEVLKDKTATLHFSVKDTGIGIPKEKLQTIFSAFSQADDSISRKFGGTGLGLAISNQYIHMMGSQIEVKSEEGRGSEFYFMIDLPVIDERSSIANQNQDVEICVLRSEDKMNCAINNVIFSYLDSWKYDYKEIASLEELSNKSGILIVCAQLFDADTCKVALDKYEKLHLLYIEGLSENFECTHEKFHLIEQPMTGSALFDKIITLTHSSNMDEKEHITSATKHFSGNVLVAEDNETNQILVSLMLEERGVDYTIVSNGKEALERASSKAFDIIFMDINMPVLDGLSATKRLRETGYTKPIVSLSANVIESDKQSFLDSGIDDTLNKPILSQELDAILQKYLSIETEEVSDIEYDTIDVDDLAKSLQIPAAVVKTLLESFQQTLQKSLQTIEKEGLSKDILHNLKGVTGNLRLEHIYSLSSRFEQEIEQCSEVEKEKQTKIVLLHLKELLKQL